MTNREKGNLETAKASGHALAIMRLLNPVYKSTVNLKSVMVNPQYDSHLEKIIKECDLHLKELKKIAKRNK